MSLKTNLVKIAVIPGFRIDAETWLNVNFFQPDSTFIVYTRKSLQRHPGRTFVWQIALVGTTIAIDGHVGEKKEERRKTKNDTQNKKKREYARARDTGRRCCVPVFIYDKGN